MDLVSPAKIPRKREPNFTADEKAFLAQLVKKRPIVESKQTDGKVIEKKKAAWESITIEFNSNLHVHKRDTLTLKRAWDNMKALTRKVRAAERGSLIRTGGGPSMPPTSPLVTIVEEAAPVIICEIDNNFDSDGVKLHQDSVEPSQEFKASIEWENTLEETSTIPDQEDTPPIVSETNIETRKPIDYVRREAVMRIKHFDNKKKIEMQILKSKLEVQEIKKRTAILLEEKARMELEEIQIRLGKH